MLWLGVIPLVSGYVAELFGTEDTNPNGGAEKLGLLERAHGGTLFIDEVADMHMETQGRLLRALQEQSDPPVGRASICRVRCLSRG